ncbi:MAG: hypothetical protein CMN78_04595 [Spirochaetales bacterium]|nr:hypothetical protein [Spirochaetales bacterium]
MKTAKYDEIAEWYDSQRSLISADRDVVFSTLVSMLGEITGKHICDLACGQGLLTHELASRGASVVGIDISDELIGIARRNEEMDPAGVTYHIDDAETLASVDDACFDGVVCNLA